MFKHRKNRETGEVYEVHNKFEIGQVPHKYFHEIIYGVLVIALCFVISYFYLSIYKSVAEVYEEETQTTVTEMKKIFLKNTVDNFVREIDWQRFHEFNHYKEIVETRCDIYKNRAISADDLISQIKSEHEPDGAKHQFGMTYIIWDDRGNVIFDPKNLIINDISDSLEAVKPRFIKYETFEKDGISIFFGYEKAFADEKIKESLAETIRGLQFDNNSYIWVNEILDYEGGDNYAIRRVHPNLSDTEGMYLSTNMTDIRGNYPYLEELEGIKKDGALFFRYYFKELNSDKVSEKLTYARLYKEYNWVIAMGVQDNEMEKYILQTNEKSKAILRSTVDLLLIILIIAIIASFLIVLLAEKLRFKKTKQQLDMEISHDSVTYSKSRKYGEVYLENAFLRYRKTGAKRLVAVMLFDIDNFKEINDNYGHCEGDSVLKEVVNAIKRTIRNTDELFRWGGDEFVGVFLDVDTENALILADKILVTVSEINVGIQPKLSVSVGISYFRHTDKNYKDSVNRADQAMYRSKKEGGNKATVGI